MFSLSNILLRVSTYVDDCIRNKCFQILQIALQVRVIFFKRDLQALHANWRYRELFIEVDRSLHGFT